MKGMGDSYETIAEMLGISRGTAINYVRQVPDGDLNEFYTNLKTLFSIKESEMLAQVLTALQTKMDRAKYGELIALYKTIKDSQQVVPQNQINIASGEMSIEFVKE